MWSVVQVVVGSLHPLSVECCVVARMLVAVPICWWPCCVVVGPLVGRSIFGPVSEIVGSDSTWFV